VALTPPTKSAAAVSLRKAKGRFLSPVPPNLGEFRGDFDTSIAGERNFRLVFGPVHRFPAPHKEKSLFFNEIQKMGKIRKLSLPGQNGPV
jgi:hypothetical protein